MGGGSNAQAQESANLQTQQGASSQRYGIATDKFTSNEYLAALKGNKDQTGVSRTFGTSLSNMTDDSGSSNSAELAKQLKSDRAEQVRRQTEEADEVRASNIAGFKNVGAISSSFGNK